MHTSDIIKGCSKDVAAGALTAGSLSSELILNALAAIAEDLREKNKTAYNPYDLTKSHKL